MQKAILDIKSESYDKVYALGDIHGCYRELLALEEKILKTARRKEAKKCLLISVGDLLDRGPDARQVIEHFVRGTAAGTHRLILGNHELFLILAFMGIRPDLLKGAEIKPSWFHEQLFKIFRVPASSIASWRQNGGKVVFESYGAAMEDFDTWDKIPKPHLQLIFEAPLIMRMPKALISHALLHVGDLEMIESVDDGRSCDEKRLDEILVRCLWERELPQERITKDKRHVSGHTPLIAVGRDQRLGTIQIDTGAVYGGQLTALDLKTFRTTQVKSEFSCR